MATNWQVLLELKLMKYLLEIDINKISAPIVGKFLYNLVAEMLEIEDPYYFLKDKYNVGVLLFTHAMSTRSKYKHPSPDDREDLLNKKAADNTSLT